MANDGLYQPNVPQLLQSGVTATGNGGVLLIKGACSQVTVVLQGTGTTSGGAVIIEEGFYDPNGDDYSGTWSALSTVNGSTFSGPGGVNQVIARMAGSYWALRVRVS